MLKMNDLLNSVDSLYHPMLKEVKITDFTKCIAIMSRQNLKDISDDVIKSYLTDWAINKYKFYKMLGDKLYIDIPISYIDEYSDTEGKIKEIIKQYPVYAPWLDAFRNARTNKIVKYDISYDIRELINEYFDYSIEGSTITHFFKRALNAPDELVTAIGRVFENVKVDGTFTISIDPIDIMFASENPYDWNSCYKLSNSHGDGPLAACIDTSSLITYIWNNEGKMKTSGYEFKNVRYKKIREWISIEPEFKAVHFNEIYPGKGSYSEDFRKQLRTIVEKVICDWTGEENKWIKDYHWYCNRENLYGYGEYYNDNIYCLKRYEDDCNEWGVFDVGIECPCGCGKILPGSDCNEEDYNNYRYNEEGIICYNFEEEYYCEYSDEYCSCECGSEDCEGCSYWQDNHPVCELDEDEPCNNWDYDDIDDGVATANKERCHGCSMWEKHCKALVEQKDQEMVTLQVDTSKYFTGKVEIPVLSAIDNNMWEIQQPTEPNSIAHIVLKDKTNQ